VLHLVAEPTLDGERLFGALSAFWHKTITGRQV